MLQVGRAAQRSGSPFPFPPPQIAQCPLNKISPQPAGNLTGILPQPLASVGRV
ncbi:MAG: hypothetical protein ICV78_08620 [Tolypothrix sp. Co-bin9]|nr:hypothetical protein [Tolypothrix sp. Co-bin9]